MEKKLNSVLIAVEVEAELGKNDSKKTHMLDKNFSAR